MMSNSAELPCRRILCASRSVADQVAAVILPTLAIVGPRNIVATELGCLYFGTTLGSSAVAFATRSASSGFRSANDLSGASMCRSAQ